MITRETILQTIGKTEDNVKEGISLLDILPFFEHYNLFLRVFNPFGLMIFRHDPTVSDNNNKKMYCMIKGNHVYTLNHDLKTLNQKLNDDEDTFTVKTNNDYRINEDKVAHECQMIETIDDLIRIYNNSEHNEKDDKQIINLILKGNDLTGFVFQLKSSGYEPSIKRESGRIVLVIVSLEKIIFIIKSQQLVPDSLDGDVAVSSDIVYNNMNKAFVNMNNQIFKHEHKSFYSNQDVSVLDENRTIVPSGLLRDFDVEKCDLVEIDISKAFSAAFMNISEIPVFNEFDIWKML